jgi:hypothetical protein
MEGNAEQVVEKRNACRILDGKARRNESTRKP